MLFDDTYFTIASVSEGTYKDRGSKFIAYAFPVYSESEVKEKITLLKKEHFNAVHHCYAYRLGVDKSAFRANDDGEPSGSAGRPILGQIQPKDLTNVLIVVVRYFGGTLLGVPGLIAAYKGAAAEAISNASIIEKQIMEVYELNFGYNSMNDIMKLLKEKELQQWDQQFELACRLKFAIRKSEAELLTEKIKSAGGTCTYLQTR
jgi:uncharacterized YigZ family protein